MNNKIKIVKGEKSWIEGSAIEQLTKFAELEGILKTVGLPDLHRGKTPVGAAFLTKEIIYPHIVGNDIGCGISLFAAGIQENKFKIEKVVQRLSKLHIEEVDIGGLTEGYNLPYKEKLGTIGSGNHFAELQKIDKIFDPNSMDKIGLNKHQIVLMVHSGSRSLGEYILDKYIREHSCQKGLYCGTESFRLYLEDHKTAMEFAELNRELIAYRIMSALNFKGYQRVLDSVHNSITEKEIQGETYYIHRKGAAPSDTGFVVIAGTRGTRSYIVKPEPNLEDYIFSISHGAGRKWPRSGCKERLERIYSRKLLRQDNLLTSNLIYRDKNLVYEEAPEAYKDIERVMEDMLYEGMIKIVASLSPLVTYKA